MPSINEAGRLRSVDYTADAPRRYASDRRCACGAVLSRYNGGSICAPCVAALPAPPEQDRGRPRTPVTAPCGCVLVFVKIGGRGELPGVGHWRRDTVCGEHR